MVTHKTSDIQLISFLPGATKVVLASVVGQDFLFTDADGQNYRWMGDLTRMKAQSLAVLFGASLQRVGMDELEWLRLGNRTQ